MLKKYINMVKKYFSLGANDRKCLINLFLSSFLRSTTILLLPYFASQIVKYLQIGDYKYTSFNLLYLAISFVLYNFSHHYNYVSYAKNAEFVHNALQRRMVNKISMFDENFSKDLSTSFIVNTAFNDIGKVQAVADTAFDAINHFVSVVVSLFVIIKVNIYLGIICLVLNVITIYFISKNQEKRDYYANEQRQNQDKISSLIGQAVEGTKEINSFSMEEDVEKYLEGYKKSWRTSYFKKRKYNDRVYVTIPMILGFGKILLYVMMAYFILKGYYDVATLVLVLGYYEEVQTKSIKFYNKLSDLSLLSVNLDRVYKVINYKTINMLDFGQNNLDDIKGEVVFDDVSFDYEDRQILRNISFEIPPNTFVAFVGKSGSGKSTIFRLLLRLYKIDKGRILIDNVNIYDYSKKVYSSNVSIVTQSPFIFDMSIRENLDLVDSSHERQIEACKRVGIHDYIMSLKDKYNTKMYKDADNLSAGQKQKLAFARTLLSKAEVLLFDEVTSNLDITSSKEVIKIMKDLSKDHTILMITHKPELMKLADEIIVINSGKIVGKGKHKDLLENNKFYQILQK